MEVHHLTKAEFDHGRTRNQGARYSRADIMVFMTDDAVPADNRLIEQLMAAFDQRGPLGESVIMAYARQLADKDCGLAERYTRSFKKCHTIFSPFFLIQSQCAFPHRK